MTYGLIINKTAQRDMSKELEIAKAPWYWNFLSVRKTMHIKYFFLKQCNNQLALDEQLTE